MRVVVVGGTGQLGRELARVLPGADTVVLSRAELDLTDTAAVAPRLAALAPSAVVNAAADNRVDAAEQDPAPAMAVNALGVAALAEACRRTGALLVHMSTDYVFDGRAARPYTEDDPPCPLVVHDQVTAPTWARDVAAALARLLPRLVRGDAPGGIYHLTNAGACSWYEFARAALALAGVDAEVEPITSAELAAPAPRPAYSVLANTRLAAIGEPPLRHWRDALAAYLAD